MRLIEMQCTNCGGKLKRRGFKKLECPYCQASYLIGEMKVSDNSDERHFQLIVPVTIAIAGVAMVVAGTVMLLEGDKENERQITVVQTVAQATESTKNSTLTWQEAIDSGVVVIVEPEEGDGFYTFAQNIFDKKYEDITQKDWESVTGIRIPGGREFHEVTCVVDGREKTFLYEGHASFAAVIMHCLISLHLTGKYK